MEEWHIPSVQWLSEPKKRQQDCLMSSAQSFSSPWLCSVAHSLTCTFPGMCHSSTHPGTSLHMTQFYQAFPHVSIASDKLWGEKTWVRGYSIASFTRETGGQKCDVMWILTNQQATRWCNALQLPSEKMLRNHLYRSILWPVHWRYFSGISKLFQLLTAPF